MTEPDAPETWFDIDDGAEAHWLEDDDVASGPDGRPDPTGREPRWEDLREDLAAEGVRAEPRPDGSVTYGWDDRATRRGLAMLGDLLEQSSPHPPHPSARPDQDAARAALRESFGDRVDGGASEHAPSGDVYGWDTRRDPHFAAPEPVSALATPGSTDGANSPTPAAPVPPDGAPSGTVPDSSDGANSGTNPHRSPSAKTPPPTPPATRAADSGSSGWALWAGRARAVWAHGPGRLQPLAWWIARAVWRRPVLWGALVTLVVLVSPVRGDHIAIALAVAVSVASGPVRPGATNRRDRFVSLRAVGAYRKQTRRVKRRWGEMWANAGLVRAALHAGGSKRLPRLVALRPHRDGVTAYVSGEHVAVGVEEVLGAARALTETSGAKSLRVTKPEARGASPVRTPDTTDQAGFSRWLTERDGRPWRQRGHLLAVTFKFQDPFPRRPIRLDELPPPSGPGKVVIGLDEEHRGLEKSLFLPSLIVGAPGSGKSTEVWTTLEALLEAGIPFRLRVFDPKGGLELGDLREAAFRYESVPSRWPRFLEQACEALRIRQEIMAKKSRLHGVQVRKIAEPTEEFPLDLMLIDELVTVLAMSRGQEARVRVFGQEMSAKEAFVVYLSQIRASLGSCIALSQLGEKSVLGPARGMFPYMSCLRVGPTEKELVDILLGQGAHNAYPAHLLDPTDPNMAGRGWVRTKGGIIGYRAAFMDDAQRSHTAKRIGAETARFRKAGQTDPEVQDAPRAPRKRAGGRAPSATPAARAARADDGGSTAAPTKRAPAKSTRATPGKATPRKKTAPSSTSAAAQSAESTTAAASDHLNGLTGGGEQS